MTTVEKKSLMLLLSVIFHYHGFDEDERALLEAKADEFDAQKEKNWANEFIASDYLSAFERAREYFKQEVTKLNLETRVTYMEMVWKANNSKGFTTEMEARALLRLARDWGTEKSLIEFAKKTN